MKNISLRFCAIIASLISISSIPLEGALQPFITIHDPATNNISISHTEGKGLGYNRGYSSLDLFLAKPLRGSTIVPFLDLRGHIFNNGRFATNAGLGCRWLNASRERVWGINFFYDSFIAYRLPYHQVSIGLEALGQIWDVRVNGYLPVGHKSTPIYALSYDFSSGFLAIAREQFAMRGVDAELGYHFPKMQYFDLYASLGPYFYFGRSQFTENAWRATSREAVGGRLRAFATFLTYLELEGSATYDSCFKWGGQVTLSLNIPFDWSRDRSCACSLIDRFFQPVIRNEIIVVDRINRFSSDPAILDPENEA